VLIALPGAVLLALSLLGLEPAANAWLRNNFSLSYHNPLPTPAAMVLISPWLDLSLSGASVARVGRRDPVLRREGLVGSARNHAGGLHLDDPRISPLFADLRTLPPTLIQVGTDEILLDDATRFADRAYAAGVEVDLQRFEGLFHDFQLFARVLGSSRAAIEDIAAFLKRSFEPRS